MATETPQPNASWRRRRKSSAATALPRRTSSTSPARSASATAASTGTSRARPRCATPSPNAGSRRSRSQLQTLAVGKGTALERLRRWLDLLVRSKRRKALDDPELFATYIELAAEARDVVRAHVETLVAQLARIVADGVARGEFEATGPAATGRAVFDATARFHNPAHAPEWSNPGIDVAYEDVRALVLNGLAPARSRRA